MEWACQAVGSDEHKASHTKTGNGSGRHVWASEEMKTNDDSLPKAGLLQFIILQNAIWTLCPPFGMRACGKDISAFQCLFSPFSSVIRPPISCGTHDHTKIDCISQSHWKAIVATQFWPG